MTLRSIVRSVWPMLGWTFGVVMFLVVVADARSVEPIVEQQSQLSHRFADLQEEHRELQAWVIERFRPWVERQVERQAETGKTVSVEPPPPPPATVAPAPSSVPSVPPTPTPAPSPEPSPTCVPVVDVCLTVAPSISA